MTKHCFTCGWNLGGHDPVCPEIVPTNRAEYDRGYRQGRAGKPEESGNTAYHLGWLKGEAALESYENSEDRVLY